MPGSSADAPGELEHTLEPEEPEAAQEAQHAIWSIMLEDVPAGPPMKTADETWRKRLLCATPLSLPHWGYDDLKIALKAAGQPHSGKKERLLGRISALRDTLIANQTAPSPA